MSSTKIMSAILTNTGHVLTKKGNIIHISIARMINSKTLINQKSIDEPVNIGVPQPEPDKIQAAVLKEFSKPLLIENVEPPQIQHKNNEVLIDVHYCALNGPDILQMRNAYTSTTTLPKILGYEVGGKILQISEGAKAKAKADGLKIGDYVVALNKLHSRGLAQQCIADITDIWKVPSSSKLVDSVCILENYMTALIGLEKKAHLEENEMVLVNVGLGGVALAAVDIAANVFRAQVIGVSATEEKAIHVREKGAFASLAFNDKKLVKKIKEFAAERGIEGVFDGTEGEKFKQILDCFTKVYGDNFSSDILRDDNFSIVVEHLSRQGRLIIAGFVPREEDNRNEMKNSLIPSGINLREYKMENYESYREVGQDVLQYYEEGLIKPSYSFITGLYNVNEAVSCISNMKCFGKVIINLKQPNTINEK
ncbi:quinone oxidoreductase-like protein 2 [Diachasma alloeum]|uniref:quinone oxidoreductase-like protein 2 n=1 Tax=Diachasma alloeum TaxID=454923 RepID=UPI0007382D6D|nr:quinone oxidoreductase-like protein 2 [Diachasma alloeum]XP_015123071.1 quinone oxidoreductase-like protein 2 [Diachasma alloeum]